MSLAAILAELQGLRGEIQELADRVHTLEISQVDRSFSSPIRGPVTVNYLAAGSPASEPVPSAPTTPGYPSPVAEVAAGSCEQRPVGVGPLSDSERRKIALRIGDFFARALAGLHRGPSGRRENPLASRLYVLCRNVSGQVFEPVRVFKTFGALKPFIGDSGFGDSVFAGFPRGQVWCGLLMSGLPEIEEVGAAHRQQLRSLTVLSGDTGLSDPTYPVGFFEVPVGDLTQKVGIILITEVDNRLVVAIPFLAWHRTVAKRVLPEKSLLKASVVSADSLSFDPDEEEPPDVWFDQDGPHRLPQAESLVQVADQLFAFQSAASEPGDGDPVAKRFEALEASLAEIKKALVPEKPSGAAPAAVAKWPERPPGLMDPPPMPGLDPEVVRSARAAGVPMAQLQTMSKMIQKDRPKLTDLPARPAVPKNPLSESEDEGDVGALEATMADGQGQDPMQVAVLKLTQIAHRLSKQKKSGSSLDLILDGGSSSSSSHRSAAALRKLRRALVDQPKLIYEVIEQNMAEDLQCLTQLPGAQAGLWTVAAELSLEDSPPFSSFPTHALATETEAPHTKLVDGRWMDLILHRLSSYDLLTEKKKLSAKKFLPPAGAEDEAKGGGKSKKGGKGDKGKGKSGGGNPSNAAAITVALVCSEVLQGDRPLDDCRPCVEGSCSLHDDAAGAVPASKSDAGRRVHGSAASTVHCSSLWNSLVRWMLHSRSGRLRTFLLSGFKMAHKHKTACTFRSVWPIPLPYTKRDGRSKSYEITPLQRGVNAIVLLLDWLHLGQPGACPREFSFAAPLTGAQQAVVQRLEKLCRPWDAAPPVTAADMGRSAGKVETLEEQLKVLMKEASALTTGYGPGAGGGQSIKKKKESDVFADVVLAKPVEADRLTFGGRPSFDPSPYLEDATRAWFQDPLKHAQKPDPDFPPPRVQVSGERSEILKLLHRLDETDRLEIFPASAIRMTHRAGLFCLPKSLQRERLILDSRPQNELEDQLLAWTQSMASAMPLLGLELCEEEALAISGEDLKDFYYYYQVSSNQQLVIGIVIDDLIAIEKIPRCLPGPESLASQVADEMVALYEKVGLQPNASKRLRSASVADFWGAHLDGEAGLIGAPIQRVLPIFLSSQVARLGFGARKLLEVLAGAWTSILQFRKRSMCLLESIFSVITAHSYQEILAIPGDLVAELWPLTTLAPLCITDLRAQTSSTLSLVDASSDWKAEVVCDFSKSFMRELGRHSLSKAAWGRMLTPYKALMRSRGVLAAEDEVPDGEEPLRAHPLWSAIVTSHQFSSVGRTKVKKGKHINISELEALLECEKRRGMLQCNSRFLIGSDSQVVLGSVLKGRSSSRSLNVRLKQHLPWLFGCNIYSSFQYVCTGENVADDPTRDRSVRSPSVSPPAWLDKAMQGDFGDMDAFLLQYELDDQSVARLPHFEEPMVPPVDPLSNRKRKREEFLRDKLRPAKPTQSVRPPVVSSRPEPWRQRLQLSTLAMDLLGQIPRSQFVLPRGKSWEDVKNNVGHLDLFSGSRGAARSLADKTGTWVLTYDIKHSASENLLSPSVQLHIEKMMDAGCFASLGAGPVCSSFSRAVRPPVRNRAHPYGLDTMSAAMRTKVREGNEFAIWLASLVRKAIRRKVVFWIENPWLSYLWDLEEWQSIAAEPGVDFFLVDYCRLGTGWRKRTKILTDTAIQGQRLLCNCRKKHIHLVGYSRSHGKSWTQVAEAYPTGLCHILSAAVSEKLKPLQRQRKLDASACARCCGRKIGEASNPGPRRPYVRGPQVPNNLEEIDTVQTSTRLLQSRAHTTFLNWLQGQLADESWEWVRQDPKQQVLFLRPFGLAQYSAGAPMYIFRHLVVLFQQQYPNQQAFIREGWSLLNRWEIAQPVSHRAPLPNLILRWTGILLIAFHGAMRIGEPLRAQRRDLLLAEEAALTGAGSLVHVHISSQFHLFNFTVTPPELRISLIACACIFLFMLAVVEDLKESVGLGRTLWRLNGRSESWVSYSWPQWASKEEVKKIKDMSELDCVKFQVAGIPTHWKVFYLVFVLLPKFALWLAVAKSGVHYLMETAGIVDLIVNSMALTFVLEVDEMVFHRFTTTLTKHIMNNIQDLPNFDITQEETETNLQALERYKAEELGSARWSKLMLSIPWRFFLVLLLQAIFVSNYYLENCQKTEDGSWVSRELRMPKDLSYRPLALMFGLLSTDGDPVWSMPTSK
eukprot:symbB.v1.2.027409.t1/scaffold2802.1/size122644/5